MLKKNFLTAACLGISMASVLTGCSITPQKNVQTEKTTEATPFVPKTEAQTESEVHTDTE